jgi:hypothetical protein
MDARLDAGPGDINASPVFFRKLAEQFLACYDAYKPAGLSIVPFFLCCRAIELALKSILLEKQNQMDMKTLFGHDLEKLYDKLPIEKKFFTQDEVRLLRKANAIYKVKHFEYMQPYDSGIGFSSFPSLEDLAWLARKTTTL